MKKLYSILLFFFSCLQHANSQSFVVDSTRFITGNNCCTEIDFAIPTKDKGILFVGVDANNPGGIIPYFPVDTVSGNVLIGKIDSNQKIVWIKVYGGSRYDQGISACQTADGGYAIAATTMSSDGDVAGSIGVGGEDLWLIKIDAGGNLLWNKCFGSTTGGTLAMSISNTPDNGFILLGSTNGSDVDVPLHYGVSLSQDWLVIKTDSAGNKQWSKDLGGTGSESEYGTILSANGGYYLVSSTNSTDHDCTDTGWHSGVATQYDYYTLRLDTSGNVLWDKSYGGTDIDVVYNAIFDDRDSSILITGSGRSDDYIEADQHGEGDMLTIKTDKNGNTIWHKSIGGGSFDNGTSVIEGPHNGYILFGNTQPSPDTTQGDIGYIDDWVFLLDSSGSEITSNIFGGTNADFSASIIQYLNGYVATGVSASFSFTEGNNYGNFDVSSMNPDGGGAFISYLGLQPLAILDIGSKKQHLLVYPNPASNIMNLYVPDQENGNLIITNCVGQTIYEQKIELSTKSIDIKDWASGLYIIKWQGEGGNMQTVKLMKI